MEYKDYRLNTFLKIHSLGRILRFFLCACMVFLTGLQAEPPNPQSILEAWDRELSIPDGFMEWKLREEPPGGLEKRIELYSEKNTNKLFIMNNSSGDPVLKFLSRGGESIHLVTLKNSSLLEKITLESSLHQSIPKTSLTYFDLVGFSLEKNFLVNAVQTYSGKEKKYWKLELKPLFSGLGKVVAYSEQDSLKPYRLDYYTTTGLLFRIVRYSFGNVNIENRGKKETGNFLNSIESFHMDTGKKSGLYLERLVKYPPVPDAIFSRSALDF